MKKILISIIITLLLFNYTNAYNSSDIVNINIDWVTTPTVFFTVPDWKKLLIKKIMTINIHPNHYLVIENIWKFSSDIEIYENINIIINDELELSVSNNDDSFYIFWFLINEDESVDNYVNNTSVWINKNIFTKDDINFIYMWEFIFINLIWIYNFFNIITVWWNKKHPIKLF